MEPAPGGNITVPKGSIPPPSTGPLDIVIWYAVGDGVGVGVDVGVGVGVGEGVGVGVEAENVIVMLPFPVTLKFKT
jgi:hypothetical protein